MSRRGPFRPSYTSGYGHHGRYDQAASSSRYDQAAISRRRQADYYKYQPKRSLDYDDRPRGSDYDFERENKKNLDRFYDEHFRTPAKKRKTTTPEKPKKTDGKLSEGNVTEEELSEDNTNDVKDLKQIIKKLRKKASLRAKTIKIKDDLIIKNKKLKEKVEMLQSKVEKHAKKGPSLEEAENLDFTLKETELKEQISQLNMDIDRIRKERNEIKKDNDRIRSERNELKDKIAVFQSSSGNENEVKLQSKVDNLIKENQVLKSKLELQTDAELQVKITNLSQENQELESKLKLQSEGFQVQVDKLHQENENLKLRIENHNLKFLKLDSKMKNEISELGIIDEAESSPDRSSCVDISDDEEDKASKKSRNVQKEFESIEDIFSDVDFEDEKFEIGRHVIRNFIAPKFSISISKGFKVPKDLTTEKFKPTPVALNNKLVFVSIGSGTGIHKGSKKACGLYSSCRIFWTEGSKITKIRVLQDVAGGQRHEVWACAHHDEASRKGYSLQTQTVVYESDSPAENKGDCQGEDGNKAK